MKINIIIALSVLTLNSSVGISQGFEERSPNTNALYRYNSQTETNRMLNNTFTGIFNSVYSPVTGAGSSVIKTQFCAGITRKYEVAKNQYSVIPGRTETTEDTTHTTVSINKKGGVRNNGMKRKSSTSTRRENK